jgi:hypothetical protein
MRNHGQKKVQIFVPLLDEGTEVHAQRMRWILGTDYSRFL